MRGEKNAVGRKAEEERPERQGCEEVQHCGPVVAPSLQ